MQPPYFVFGICQSYVRAEGFTFFRGRRGNAEAELVDLEAGLISPLGFGPPAAAPLKPSGQAQCSAQSLCKIQALVRGAVQRAAFVRARAACVLIQRAWRRVCRIDALGKKLLRQAPAGTFPALHFDSEDLQEAAFTEKEKWLVLKAAPTFVQRNAPVAMMFGVEARRLTLARLCGDIGSATASEEEINPRTATSTRGTWPPALEETGGLTVFAAQKVVGGPFAKVHRLSSGSVLELEGLGSYQSCGAGKALVHELEAFAKEEGHFAIILLAAPSAIAFYEWLGFVKATDARTPVGQALFYLSSKAQFQHLPMLKCMDAMWKHCAKNYWGRLVRSLSLEYDTILSDWLKDTVVAISLEFAFDPPRYPISWCHHPRGLSKEGCMVPR